jgi:DNA polymerase III subunit epsilon
VARLTTPSIGTAAVLDVETTGFSHCNDEIIELAMTLFRYDRVAGHVLGIVGEYSGLREPSCLIPRCASAVHRITRRLVRGCRLDYRRIRGMLRQADFVVAHCMAFDRGFVERLMPSFRDARWLCSRDDIDWWAKGFETRSLEDLAFAHAIENPRPHRASGDTATLLALLRYQPRRRRPYLYDLLRNTGLLTIRLPQKTR